MAPRARTPSFSSQRIASAYSSRNKKMAAHVLPTQTHMTVVNWENVLVPMDWMVVHLGLGKSIESIHLAVMRSQSSPELLCSVAAIQESIMELLTEAMRNGPVFIVSDYTTVYVEFASSLFFPWLTAALRSATTGIYVVGTPDTQLSSLELNQWKANLLHTVIFERVFAGVSTAETKNLLKRSASGRIGVVGLCAKDADMVATSALNSIAPNAVIKRVKVKPGRPSCPTHPLGSPVSLDDFYAQLQTLIQFVKQASASTNPVSITL